MNRFFLWLNETFTMIGCARAASELARMGQYEAAQNLTMHYKGIQVERSKRREAAKKETLNKLTAV